MDGPREGVIRKLRGGVASILLMPKRFSQVVDEEVETASTPRRRVSRYADADEEDEEPHSPITIHITSPSKFERRQSGLARYSIGEASMDSEKEEEGSGEVEVEVQVQTATRVRMSASPRYVLGNERVGGKLEEYELDWLQSSILPQ
jgi:hypothetical protein